MDKPLVAGFSDRNVSVLNLATFTPLKHLSSVDFKILGGQIVDILKRSKILNQFLPPIVPTNIIDRRNVISDNMRKLDVWYI